MSTPPHRPNDTQPPTTPSSPTTHGHLTPTSYGHLTPPSTPANPYPLPTTILTNTAYQSHAHAHNHLTFFLFPLPTFIRNIYRTPTGTYLYEPIYIIQDFFPTPTGALILTPLIGLGLTLVPARLRWEIAGWGLGGVTWGLAAVRWWCEEDEVKEEEEKEGQEVVRGLLIGCHKLLLLLVTCRSLACTASWRVCSDLGCESAVIALIVHILLRMKELHSLLDSPNTPKIDKDHWNTCAYLSLCRSDALNLGSSLVIDDEGLITNELCESIVADGLLG